MATVPSMVNRTRTKPFAAGATSGLNIVSESRNRPYASAPRIELLSVPPVNVAFAARERPDLARVLATATRRS